MTDIDAGIEYQRIATTIAAQHSKTGDKIRAFHAQCPDATQAQICKALGVSSGTVSKALKPKKEKTAAKPDPPAEPVQEVKRGKGRPVGAVKSDRTERMTIMMSPTTAQRLRLYCHIYGVSAAEVVEDAIKSHCRLTADSLADILDK